MRDEINPILESNSVYISNTQFQTMLERKEELFENYELLEHHTQLMITAERGFIK